MALAASQPDAPLGDINTTPLIDVLLVLLVMIVITIPVATHSVDVDLPNCEGDCELPPVDLLRNRVAIDSVDRILWNGHQVSKGELAAVLASARSLPVEPELQFSPEAGASYDVAAHTLRIIKASGATKFGFVGNERFRNFAL